jgi:hypothetical protein
MLPKMQKTDLRALLLALLWVAAGGPALAVTVPPAGDCPPYPIDPGGSGAPSEDVVPSLIRPGDRIDLGGLSRIRNYLPPEVWARREAFFHEAMRMEVGPCHRRYPAAAFFRNATREHAGRARLDAEGNLLEYAGVGLPFPVEGIADDAEDAGQRWGWNYRYRYAAGGFRGAFRLMHVDPRKGEGDRFEGTIAWVPLNGIPGLPESGARRHSFAASGSFQKPAIARGVAWRQLRPSEADRSFQRSDDLFVWIPEQRKVRRSPPQSIDGLYMPAYHRGQMGDATTLSLPDSGMSRVPDSSLAVIEQQRRGFVGLFLRPNAYRFHLVRVQDVLAPINSYRFGYPADSARSYGPTGLSLATDRWELRRAVVLQGRRREASQMVHSVTLYVDVLTQQPLYFISRRKNELVHEVGILMGKFSDDDPMHPRWEKQEKGTGVILPVAAAFFVAREGSWLRESFELRSDPPEAKELEDLTTTIRLQRGR